MRVLVATLVLGIASCASSSSTSDPEPAGISLLSAQSIVDATAKKHADVARLSIHALHESEDRMRIIASTVSGRVGEASDPEDIKALETGQAVVLHEGRNLDYTLPVKDSTGRKTMVIGVTISGTVSESESRLVARAKEVAAEVEKALLADEKTHE